METRINTASHHEIRRRSSAADRGPALLPSTLAAMATTTTFAADFEGMDRAHRCETNKLADGRARNRGNDAQIMPPPPPPPPPTSANNNPDTRQSRSHSAASRLPNRLSLTLPIAPPTSDASRPTPLSAAPSTISPTPMEAAAVAPSADANDFIIAIAAQERRVLELREELARAEAELVTLKKQWTASEPYPRRGGGHYPDLRKAGTPGASNEDDAAVASRRSIELDRRKLLLQNHSQSSTPTQSRRKVLRGGHARALSLLSPPQTNTEFFVHEDNGQERADRGTGQLVGSVLPKRASWQPRSAQNSPGVPQLVEDFKLGLRQFVDDLRQITVGDEPVRGQPGRGPSAQQHSGATNRGTSGDSQWTGAGSAAQSRMATAADTPGSGTSTPTPAARNAGATISRPKPTKSKHYSWTPLGIDSMDDSDWSNWESAGPAKSPRWSGSTMSSAGLESIGSIPEAGEEAATPVSTNKSAPSAVTALSPPKLEEMLPSVVNRLSPSNLTRTANNLMDEWEKSLVAPAPRDDKENSSVKT